MKSLRVFEVVARLGGVSKAAEELCVSQGAVSQQIRNLEDYLGSELFIRKPGSFELSEQGRAFALVVRNALIEIAEAVDKFSPVRDSSQLLISTWQGFATRWLIPNLGAFYALNPDVTVALDQSTGITKLRNDGIDAAIRFGERDTSDHNRVLLFHPKICAVASPQYLVKRGALKTIKQPHGHVIIDHSYPSVELRKQHVHWEDVIMGDMADLDVEYLSFPDENQSLNAAILGQGIALVSNYCIEKELNAREVVLAAPDFVPHKGAIYFVWPKHVRVNPALDLLRDWLVATLARY